MNDWFIGTTTGIGVIAGSVCAGFFIDALCKLIGV